MFPVLEYLRMGKMWKRADKMTKNSSLMVEQTIETAIKPVIKSLFELEDSKNNELISLSNSTVPFANSVHEIVVRNEERKKISKERFNVFTCLTKHHLEELHSNFIHYLLDPKSSHDCGCLFLKLFLNSVRHVQGINAELDNISSIEFKNAIVLKELSIGRSSESDIYGFIDIYIETENFVIVIENKVNAHEQKDQISRYARYCINTKKMPLVFYLTIDGRESTQSLGEKYFPISYQEHIINWLDSSIKECWKYPLVYAGIYYYKELINKHILNKPSNIIIMEIRELLLRKENLLILKYLPEISSSIVPIRNKLRLDFIYKIFEILKEEQFVVCAVHRINNENVSLNDFFKDQYRGIKIKNEEITTSIGTQNFIFCIEHEYPELYFGLFGRYKSSMNENQIIQSLRNKLPKFALGENEHWACWKTFRINDIDFGDDRLNYEFATNLDNIVSDFMIELRLFIAAWKETIVELSKQ